MNNDKTTMQIDRDKFIIFNLLVFNIDMIKTIIKINSRAIIEALPPSNSIVRIEEKIIITDNNFNVFTFVLNVK